jgi:hypothetical protein
MKLFHCLILNLKIILFSKHLSKNIKIPFYNGIEKSFY